MDAFTLLVFSLIAVFALFLLWLEGLLSGAKRQLLCLLLVIAAFVLRLICMAHVTADYTNFLSVWVDYFRDNGGFSALSQSVGNYNVPYLYFLAAISCSGSSDLIWIKLFSIFFDVLLAYGVMKLVGLSAHGEARRLFSFFAVLFLPTVLLNGAYWGQCDSVYTAFAVLSIWCALSDHPVLSVILIALSFSFKLQAVFIMPVFLVFLFTGHIKPKHLPAFPLTYLVVVLPAVLAGRPLVDTLTLYIDQGGTVGSGLNYNSPSLFAILRNATPELWSKAGIILAFLFLVLLYLWFLKVRDSLTRESLVAICALMCIGIPFLLPHMHDRYFFPADIFTLAFALCLPRYFLVPIFTQFASLLGYHAYLRGRYLLPMRQGSYALIAAMLLLGLYLSATTMDLTRERE